VWRTQVAWEELNEMPEGSLAQLRFGVFGLGNKNTRHDFNNAAKVRMRYSTESPVNFNLNCTHALPHTPPHRNCTQSCWRSVPRTSTSSGSAANSIPMGTYAFKVQIQIIV
jgi:hypothetical protein